MSSQDVLSENVEKIAVLFPNCVTETAKGKAIDFDLLKQELNNKVIEGDKERYRLEWPGKREAIVTANLPTTKTLRPVRKDSVDFDNTENLYIEGDNLEVLKLLQESYLDKIKMIYIDPPYNTGKDFVYKDNFRQSKKEFEEENGLKEEKDNRLDLNSDNSGRYHSNWLSMMYPRLKLARNLLKEDGVIFISIDDNELTNLKKICDEIFGEINYVNTISAKMKNVAGASGGGEDKRLKKNLEYILIYVKKYSKFNSFSPIYNKTEISEILNYYNLNNISWKYTSALVYEGEKKYIGKTFDGDGNAIKIYKRKNPIIKPIKQIMNNEKLSISEVYYKYFAKIFRTTMPQSSIRVRVMEKVTDLNLDNDLYSIEYVPKRGKNKGKLYSQFYKGDKFNLLAWFSDVGVKEKDKVYKLDKLGTLWEKINLNNLTKEGGVKFENGKKPIKLLQDLIQMANLKENDIILDFFSGSASTAHAAIQMNFKTSKKRKFIMVQYPEETTAYPEDNLFNICEIGKERIRRAGKKILKESMLKERELKSDSKEKTKLDIGFRVFRLDSSNMKDGYYKPQDYNQGRLEILTDNVKSGRNSDDLLAQVMLDLGLPLSLKIQQVDLLGKKLFKVAENSLFACFDTFIDEGFAKEIAKESPLRVVFKDNAFKDDDAKVNVKQLLKQLSPETEMKVL